MSRIGKKLIVPPAGVEFTITPASLDAGEVVSVKGPKGQLTLNVHPDVHVELTEVDGAKSVVITVKDPSEKKQNSLWGTTRALLANMVTGVTMGFTRTLEINGVGFRAQASGKSLKLTLGFSHDIDFPIPEGLQATVEKNVITISGADRQAVGQMAATIRGLKKPEPYLGKGIKYTDEVVRRKAGKAAKSAE